VWLIVCVTAPELRPSGFSLPWLEQAISLLWASTVHLANWFICAFTKICTSSQHSDCCTAITGKISHYYYWPKYFLQPFELLQKTALSHFPVRQRSFQQYFTLLGTLKNCIAPLQSPMCYATYWTEVKDRWRNAHLWPLEKLKILDRR
jgi:hypothetical protein